ncbi:MAG: hypothetical protein AAF821_17150 [Cyanobacteria bacterium P01_D01_bin.156]
MSSFLQAAKDGDIKALETMMNKSFHPKGVNVRVSNTGSILKVILSTSEGAEPDRKIAKLIRNGLRKINPQGFKAVFVKAQSAKQTLWSAQWKLTHHKNPKAANIPASHTPQQRQKLQRELQQKTVHQHHNSDQTKASTTTLTPQHIESTLALTNTAVKKRQTYYKGETDAISLHPTKPRQKSKRVSYKTISSQQRNHFLHISFGLTLLAVSGITFWNLLRRNNIIVSTKTPVLPASDDTTAISDLEESDPFTLQEQTIQPDTSNQAPTLPIDNSYQSAIKQALTAVDQSKTATSYTDWNDAASAWNRAVSLMQLVPKSDQNYETAQEKAQEYWRNFRYAQEQSITLQPNIGASKINMLSRLNDLGKGFAFENAPLTDGTPRLIGNSSDELANVELYGLTDTLTKATMSIVIGRKHALETLNIYGVGFLTELIPDYDWQGKLANTVAMQLKSNDHEERVLVEDNVISIKLTNVSEGFTFLVSVDPQ